MKSQDGRIQLPIRTAADTKTSLSTADTSTYNTPSIFDLPAELRNLVYRYAVLRDPLEIYPPMPIWGYHREPGFCVQPGGRVNHRLLQTCKQIAREASPIMYGKNVFGLYNIHDIGEPFLRHIGLNAIHLRHISIMWQYHEEWRFMIALRRVVSLNTLTINVEPNWFGVTEEDVAATLRLLLDHLHARRKGTGKKPAIDVLVWKGVVWPGVSTTWQRIERDEQEAKSFGVRVRALLECVLI
ncbi:hypothetical protein Slin14017_G084110 [Septoria linicola]|nr:hypothetical protein Slin14017_G084110 [Septoria linicola]